MGQRRKMRSPKFSEEIHADRVFPDDLNTLGRLSGWRVMEITDKTAGIVAERHSGMVCVTKKAEFSFEGTARSGEILRIRARIVEVWNSSCMIFAVFSATSPARHTPRRDVGNAWLLFVALDEKEKPLPIHYGLAIKTEGEQRLRLIASEKKEYWLASDKKLAELLKSELRSFR